MHYYKVFWPLTRSSVFYSGAVNQGEIRLLAVVKLQHLKITGSAHCTALILQSEWHLLASVAYRASLQWVLLCLTEFILAWVDFGLLMCLPFRKEGILEVSVWIFKPLTSASSSCLPRKLKAFFVMESLPVFPSHSLGILPSWLSTSDWYYQESIYSCFRSKLQGPVHHPLIPCLLFYNIFKIRSAKASIKWRNVAVKCITAISVNHIAYICTCFL